MTHPIISALLTPHGFFTVKQLSDLCQLGESQTRDRLREMTNKDIIERHPRKRKMFYRVIDRQKLIGIAEEREPMTVNKDYDLPDMTLPLAEILGYRAISPSIKPRHISERHNPDVAPRNFGPYCHSSIEYI